MRVVAFVLFTRVFRVFTLGNVFLAAILSLGVPAAFAQATATPTFSPVAGSYTGVQTVTISDSTSGASIFYTTNGTTPTTSSTHYTAPISVAATETVKAIATASGHTQSVAGSAAYTLTVNTPTFSPVAGTYNNTQTVTISDAVAGASIFYTTNGTTPTTSSTHYTGPITVGATETVKAIATATGMTQSAVASATYTLTAATPTFSPVAGSYTSAQTVAISDATSGASIFYTTNGTTPTTSSTPYTGPISVSATETVKAIATATGMTQSAIGSAAYTITLTAATPTFSPVTGSYAGPLTVTISDSTPGASIHYTTNGTTPTTSSAHYTAPITVTSSETVKAIATATGFSQSAVGSVAYTILGPTTDPVVSPAFGFYNVTSMTVTVTDSQSGAVIHYTTDGSVPTAASPVYTGPITVNIPLQYLDVIAIAPGFAASNDVFGSYNLNIPAATPVFSPPAGNYPTPQSVTITESTSGSTIHYSINGSAPNDFYPTYTSPISVSNNTNLQAIGGSTSSGYTDSAVASATYTVGPQISSLTPGSGTGGTSLTISGVGFGASQGTSTIAVYPNTGTPVDTTGAPMTVTSWNNTQIIAQLPTGALSGNDCLVVTAASTTSTYTPNGSNCAPLTVSPTITTITPTSGISHDYVKVVGSNFNSNAYCGTPSNVTFNGAAASPTTLTAGLIEVLVPVNVTTGPVVVNSCLPGTSSTVASNGLTFTAPTAPTISGLSPVAGPTGTTVTIAGANFGTSAGTVSFNGTAATVVTWGTETIEVTVPSGATTGPVVVTSGGISGNSYTFTVSGTITGISPVLGAVGTSVTISGSGFGATQGGSTLTFNGIPAIPSSWSSMAIVAPVPAGATTGNLAMEVNGTTASGPSFIVLPGITSLSPSSGPVGSLVTINGTSFGLTQGISTVAFGSVLAAPTSWSPNQIQVPVPAGAVTGSVVVSVGGETSNSQTFTVGASSLLGSIGGTITKPDGVTPIQGATITGFVSNVPFASSVTNASGIYSFPNLTAGTYGVRVSAFGYSAGGQTGISLAAGQAVVSNFSLTAQTQITYAYDALGRLTGVVSPTQGAATYAYDAVGNIASISRTTVGQPATFSFTPVSGPIGTTVTISGAGFNSTPSQNTVKVGSVTAAVVSAAAGQLVITVPTGSVTGSISVTTSAGTSISAMPFTVTPSAGTPVVSSFTPVIASAGAAVTISGSGFDTLANDGVIFGDARATIASATPTSIVAIVPGAASSGPISVGTPLGSTVSSSDFYLVPPTFASSQVDFTSRLTLGTPYTGHITTGGDIGLVIFNATAGQQFNLGVSGSTIASGNVSILDPTGLEVQNASIGTGGSLIESVPATMSGTYTVLVTTNGALSTGNLTFTLSAATPVTTVATIVTGPIAVNTVGQSATIVFNGTAGKSVGVLLSNATFPGGCYNVNLTVYKPDGSVLSSQNNCNQVSLVFQPSVLPVTGNYTAVITPQVVPVTATVTLAVFDEVTETVTPGNPVVVNINAPGQYAQLNFSGTAGKYASVLLLNSTFPGICSTLQVVVQAPDGSVLARPFMCRQGRFFVDAVQLPLTGTYTIFIYPDFGGSGTGSASVLVSQFAEQVGSIASGTATPLAINVPGQNVQYTFSATAGQQVSVSFTNATFVGSCSTMNFGIYTSTGARLLNNDMCGASSYTTGTVTLPSTGTYTLILSPYNGLTGSGTVNLSVQ